MLDAAGPPLLDPKYRSPVLGSQSPSRPDMNVMVRLPVPVLRATSPPTPRTLKPSVETLPQSASHPSPATVVIAPVSTRGDNGCSPDTGGAVSSPGSSTDPPSKRPPHPPPGATGTPCSGG